MINYTVHVRVQKPCLVISDVYNSMKTDANDMISHSGYNIMFIDRLEVYNNTMVKIQHAWHTHTA